MEMKKFGNTGMLVSDLCLGTMTFGWQANEDQSHEILDHFTENGGNFIDTSNVYSHGKSETIIGEVTSGFLRSQLMDTCAMLL